MFSKDPKRSKLVGMDTSQDRISKLPNAVLCHILSFLPTPFSVRTTVLSKRWVNIWTSVSTLDFDDSTVLQAFRSAGESVYENKFDWFISFVEMVLALRDRLNIQKCSLKCHEASPSCHIYQWVSSIITSKVEEFIIEGSSQYDVPKQLPCSLFTCQTLITLKVKGKFVLNIPNSVCFPRLKTLHLHSVIYPDDTSVERLFASCPVVEDLDVQRRDLDGVLTFKISIPSLKRLSMAGCDGKTVVNAPNLEYLSFSDPSEDCSFNLSSSLAEASLFGVHAYELLQIVSHVRVLTVPGKTMMGLCFSGCKDDLPIYHNLTRMELGTEGILGWQVLKYLLQRSPNLEDLVFLEGLAQPTCSRERWIWHPLFIPAELLVHFKTIEIHQFFGKPIEVTLVQHLLKHAAELERMTIYWNDFDKDVKAQRIGNGILKCRRASTGCDLSIISVFCVPSAICPKLEL